MYGGETNVSKPVAQIIRTAGLLVPAGLLVYGVLATKGIVDNHHYLSDSYFYGLMSFWLIVAIIQFLFPIKRRRTAAVHLILYHILALAYILGVSGFTAPFSSAWIILFFACYAYFSKPGFYLSVATLFIGATITFVLPIPSPENVAVDVITLLSIVVVGLVVMAIGRSQEIGAAELIRTKAQETLQRDRMITLVNNLTDAILSTDEEGVVRVYNAASLNLLDTNASLNGQHIDDILPLYTKDGDSFKLHSALKKARSVVMRDDLIFKIEGEELRLEVTYSPIRSSSFADTKHTRSQDGYILILRDVTKAKSLEEERDEFISVVSHELRTPITIAEATISNVQIMMDRPEIAKNVLRESADTAHDQILYLAKMVNDLSTLSRAERGVADAPETIGVRDLINELYTEYAPQAEAKKLHFNLDLDNHLGHVKASPLYLKELLQNFITNSLKYTKEGEITLRVAREKDNLTFEVKDTGIGISKSDQGKIFNKFYRSEDYRTRETSGTGLGLYVSAKLAKKLGTKIYFHSRLNHGSTFSFTLPATTD
jgi:signal transduction histidine kinase